MENEIDDSKLLSEAAAMMGRVKTQKKAAAAQENGKLGGRPKGVGKPFTEDAKVKMKAAQQNRREREKTKTDLGQMDRHDPLHSVRPILFEADNGDFPYGAGGTSFVVEYHNSLYVFTARHCLKDTTPETVFIQDRRNSKQSLPFARVYSGIGDEYGDPMYSDLVILRVAMEKIDLTILDQIECFSIKSLVPIPPANLYNGRLIYRGFLKKSSGQINVGIDYDKKNIRWLPIQGESTYAGPSDYESVQTMTFINVPSEVTDLDGLSGSPVFQLTKLHDEQELWQLAGMIVRASASGNIANFIDTTALYAALEQAITST